MKQKFDIIKSTCIPIDIDNCNTDLIIPARYLASTTRDPQFFGDAFMHDLRFAADGTKVADFVMNQPAFCEAPHPGVHEIIIGGQNWGSGSSREHAAWAIAGYGVRAVISSSFADIHRNNLLNCFVLPVVVSRSFQQELFASIASDPDCDQPGYRQQRAFRNQRLQEILPDECTRRHRLPARQPGKN